MSKAGYRKDELLLAANEDSPTRGELCPKCGEIIPDFADLTEADEALVRRWIREGRNIMAMHELRSVTGCPISWAKIWVTHEGRPDAVGTTAPCPYCGKPLVTALAKQCRYCKMDWHDPANPKRLGTANPSK